MERGGWKGTEMDNLDQNIQITVCFRPRLNSVVNITVVLLLLITT